MTYDTCALVLISGESIPIYLVINIIVNSQELVLKCLGVTFVFPESPYRLNVQVKWVLFYNLAN